jgi:phosphoribosylformylglycinamidine cyclo-ligase
VSDEAHPQRASGSTGAAAPLDYRAAGVDIDASDDAKRRIRKLVESTYTAGVRGAFGAFGGMFRFPTDVEKPLIVASADGVGTKTKVAIEAGRHDTIGHDLVNHCVNDILVQGAKPLFFLDYVAFGKLEPSIVEAVVAGVAAGCTENGCALLGGETAEMPGVYTPPDYDLAGFIVGCVSEDRVLGSGRVRDGDVLVGLASTGLHTNGYSLARRIVQDRMKLAAADRFPGTDVTVADAMLAVHASYLAAVEPALGAVHAMAHITGGGLPGNLDRALPPSLDAVVKLSSWDVPVLFRELQRAGSVPTDDMFRSFNMGVGMVVICDEEDAGAVIQSAARAGIAGWRLGEIRSGSGRVVLE